MFLIIIAQLKTCISLFTIFRSLVAILCIIILGKNISLNKLFIIISPIKNIFNDLWVLISDFML